MCRRTHCDCSCWRRYSGVDRSDSFDGDETAELVAVRHCDYSGSNIRLARLLRNQLDRNWSVLIWLNFDLLCGHVWVFLSRREAIGC